MMGLFKPRLLLSTFARVDLELLMRRTVEVVGREAIVRCDVIGGIDQLPLSNQSPESMVRSAQSCVARQLNVPMDSIDVTIEADPEFAHASLYDQGRVRLNRMLVDDRLATVMEIANAYSQHFWLSQPAPRPLDSHPRTTTLLPIAMGLGVLASSASLQEKHWSTFGYSGWSMSRSGYYTAIEIGYAMALLARMRGQADPPWLRLLRPDTRKTTSAALNFFANHHSRGGHLLFDAQRIPTSDRDATELTAWLAGDDATFAMAAAYALAKQESIPEMAIEPTLKLSAGKDAELSVVATRLLGVADGGDPRIDARIETAIAGKIAAVSLAALLAAQKRGLPMGRWTKRIETLLIGSDVDLIPLVELITGNADELASLAPTICQQAEMAIDHDDVDATTTLLACLSALTDSPVSMIETTMRSAPAKAHAIATFNTSTSTH